MANPAHRPRARAPGKGRIASAARRLFARRGYAGTSMADVAAAAGVSKATVFHHFGNKRGLYQALIADAVSGFREQVVPLLDAEGETDYSEPLRPSLDRLPVDPSTDVPDGYTDAQRNQPNGFVADPDIMDTWATSSLTPQIAGRWIDDPDLFALVEETLAYRGKVDWRFAANP